MVTSIEEAIIKEESVPLILPPQTIQISVPSHSNPVTRNPITQSLAQSISSKLEVRVTKGKYEQVNKFFEDLLSSSSSDNEESDQEEL